ncbi:MAG: hypothetical protein J6N51_15855, partial [Selenomonas sp.]|nr:hypothetical protein [Selenomonas sp.]
IKAVLAPAALQPSAWGHDADWPDRSDDAIIYMTGGRLAEHCLRFGLPGDWSLSGILFRRSELSQLSWLKNLFFEGRCMLAMLCSMLFDNESMFGIMCESALDLPPETAEMAILREMERYYLLQGALSAGTLSRVSCLSALSDWEVWREGHIGRLRAEANKGLCDMYEQMGQG